MKRLAVAVVSVAVAAGVSVVSYHAAAPGARAAVVREPAAVQPVFYGHVKSLVRKGGRWWLRFDPAWWLTGVAAEQAKLHDTGSKDVPNDYYIVDEGHRVLTFTVSGKARVTVLTDDPSGSTEIDVEELAQILRGENPRNRHLIEPEAGFWIRIGTRYPAPVISLDQQFQP